MEYAAGGELFERICSAGRFGEDEVTLLFIYYVLIKKSQYVNKPCLTKKKEPNKEVCV